MGYLPHAVGTAKNEWNSRENESTNRVGVRMWKDWVSERNAMNGEVFIPLEFVEACMIFVHCMVQISYLCDVY